MKVSELAATLNDLSTQLGKAKDEIIGKIEELEFALSEVEVPAEAADLIVSLKATAQALDDVVPDIR